MNIQLTRRFAILGAALLLVSMIIYIFLVKNYYISLLKGDGNTTYIIEQINTLTYYSLSIAGAASILFLVVLFRFINLRERERFVLRELQDLSDENRRYFDNAAIGFVVVNEDRNMLSVNPKFCEIFGYEAHELIGKNVLMLHVDQTHYEEWGRQMLAKVREGGKVVMRYPLKYRDGSRIWVDITGSSLQEENYFPGGGVLWTVSEVSAEVRTLQLLENTNLQLNENLGYLTTLINTAPTPLYVKDESFRYQECNSAFLELFGKSRDEVIGKRDEDIFDIFFAEQIALKDKMILEQGNHTFKLRFLSNGIVRVMEFYTSAIIHKESFNGYIGFCVDITEKENRELYLNQRVEQEVIKNMALQKQHFEERMNDVKFSALGKLAAGITHEINTPLTYIKGNLEIVAMEIASLPQGEANSEILQDLERTHEGIKRIESIVASMREMSQQSGEQKEEANLLETVITALTLGYSRSKHIASITVQGKEFEFGMHAIKHTQCKVMVQRQRIEQVWVIILNNALDALEEHGHFDANHITITCKKKAKQVMIRFEDTGGGIDDAILGVIFDPFVSSKLQGGIGIGLNIAKKIVADHHGTIQAFNSKEGAVFEVTLPIANQN